MTMTSKIKKCNNSVKTKARLNIRNSAPKLLNEFKELNEWDDENILVIATDPCKEDLRLFTHFYYSKIDLNDHLYGSFSTKHPQLIGVAFNMHGEEVEIN